MKSSLLNRVCPGTLIFLGLILSSPSHAFAAEGDVSTGNAVHDTVLIDHAGFGRLASIKILLKRGAHPNLRNDVGRTALWQAAQAPLSESGEYSLEKGPLPATPAQRRKWDRTYVGIIQQLIAHGANPNLPDFNGMTPLGIAACTGREAEVAALLKCGANPNLRDHFRKTPIQWAAYIGFPRIVVLLRKHGAWIAKPGLRNPVQRDLDEQLLAAVSSKNIDSIRSLLRRRADVNAHVNLWNRHSPYVPAPMKIEASEQFGFYTPLLAAESDPDITRLLLKYGADPNLPGGEGTTPLIESNRVDTSKILIARGARVNVRSHRGETALMKHADDPQIVSLLLAHGANLRFRDSNGSSALMVCDNERALKLLLAHGAKIDEHDKEGRTSLHHASAQQVGEASLPYCSPDFARVLLRHKANPNARDRKGNTPLMLLAWQGDFGEYEANQLRLARLLLAAGARRNLRNYQGRTALQIARRTGAIKLVQLLEVQ